MNDYNLIKADEYVDMIGDEEAREDAICNMMEEVESEFPEWVWEHAGRELDDLVYYEAARRLTKRNGERSEP